MEVESNYQKHKENPKYLKRYTSKESPCLKGKTQTETGKDFKLN